MTEQERRDQQILYISDDAVPEEQKKCRAILQKLNFMDRAVFAGISALVKELFGTSDGAFLNPPFYCDYGSHIHVGKNFFANYNCTASPGLAFRRPPFWGSLPRLRSTTFLLTLTSTPVSTVDVTLQIYSDEKNLKKLALTY